MAKVLVLYYSSWGHMEQMANAAAEGPSRRWTVNQPWLLFALSIRVAVDRAHREVELALPLDVRFDG